MRAEEVRAEVRAVAFVQRAQQGFTLKKTTVPSQSQRPLEFSVLDGEIYLARRMLEQRLDTDLFEGVTGHADRCDRARLAITALGCDTTIIGRRPDGKPETYAQFFERLYGEPLRAKRKAKEGTIRGP